MLNRKKDSWVLVHNYSNSPILPELNTEVIILVEDDYYENNGFRDEFGEIYYPKVFRAELKRGMFGFFWKLLYEPEENEQFILAYQTIVAWRYDMQGNRDNSLEAVVNKTNDNNHLAMFQKQKQVVVVLH